MPEVVVEDLVKTYGAFRASDSVGLTIKDGEFLTLLGPSGCGKTTLLRSVAGLERPDSGRITIDGRVVADPARRIFVRPEHRDLGMVFQSYALWPHMTVFQNVAYPLKLRGESRDAIRGRVADLLKPLGLGDLQKRLISELSGGQQQRVALARALASGAGLVLYDEPLSNLDARMRITMRDEIRAVHEKMGTTSIFVTHDQEEALALSDRVVVMRAGRVVQMGTPQEVYGSPRDSYVADFLGFENIFSAAWGDDTATGDHRLVLENGKALLPAPAGLRDRDWGNGVAIKASHVRIGPAVQPDEGGVLQGKVRSRTYVGSRTTFTVDVNGLDIHVQVLNHLTRVEDLPVEGEITTVQLPGVLLAPLYDTAE